MFYLLRSKMGCERKSIRTGTNDNNEAFAHNRDLTRPFPGFLELNINVSGLQ